MAEPLDGQGPFKEEVQKFVEESGIKESSEEILGPFSDIAQQIAAAVWNAVFPGSTSSLWWPMLVLTALITTGFWMFRRGRGAKDADGRERPMGLLEYIVPKRIYTHAWQPGDVVIWDNRCVLHRARPWSLDEPRVMHHTRVNGDPYTELSLTATNEQENAA